MVERKSLIVYFKNKKVLEEIEGDINIAYVSPRFNYAVLYMDKPLANKLRNQLPNMKGVKSVLDSKLELESF